VARHEKSSAKVGGCAVGGKRPRGLLKSIHSGAKRALGGSKVSGSPPVKTFCKVSPKTALMFRRGNLRHAFHGRWPQGDREERHGRLAPTGVAFNPTTSFPVAPNVKAVFLFVTEDGTISGWNPGVNPNAIVIKDRGGKAIYKGCAIAQGTSGPKFYPTNFQSGRVEVFDANFNKLHLDDDAFRLHGLSHDYAPFNIQNVGGNLVVTFAHREEGSKDEDHAPGLGFVGVFDHRGRLLLRLEHSPWFNAPWGVALAPGDFGLFSHRLVIGNFGDGTINAFNLMTGKHEGPCWMTQRVKLSLSMACGRSALVETRPTMDWPLALLHRWSER